MKRILKRLLLFFSIFFIIILVVASIIAMLFEEQIGQRVITEINKQLKSELQVEELDISVLSSFPKGAVNLRGVVLGDTNNGELLKAEKIACRFGLFSLMSSNIKISSIEIEEGALSIAIDKKGEANYDILKESQAEEDPEEGVGISLEQARLEDLDVKYVNAQAKQNVLARINEATFSGDFSSNEFSLSSIANFTTRFVEVDDVRILVGKKLGYDAKVLVNLAENKYDLEAVQVSLGNNVFNISGLMEMADQHSDYDLKIHSDEGSLEALFQLLPKTYQAYMEDFSSSGSFLMDATVKGRMDKQDMPAIDMDLKFEDGRIGSSKLEDAFKDVSFEANFTNGKAHTNKTSIFEIKNLKGYFNRELIELGLRVEDLDDPRINIDLDGTIPLESVYGLFDSPIITSGDGELEIKQLHINGRYNDMITPSRISRVQASGQLEFDDAELTINKETLIADRGSLILDGNLLTIDKIKIEGAGSEIIFEGKASNLLPVLFADENNSKRAELQFEASLRSSQLDLDKMVGIMDVGVEEGEVQQEIYDSLKVENIEKKEFVTSLLNGTFDALIDEYHYNKIKGTDFQGKVIFNGNQVSLKGETKAMEGTFDLDGKMYFEEQPHLNAKLSCKNLDASVFFAQTENFGQDVLVSKNVKGSLHSNMLINAYWDREGSFLMDDLQVYAAIALEDGELVNFKILEDFSTYIKVRDLRHIKFTNAQNWLEIKNSKVYMPAMFIRSNAMNMTIGGEHSFDNELDYNIKINAGQVVSNRFKKFNPELQPQPSKKNGWFNLYYKIYGSIDDFEYKMAKREIKRDFQLSQYKKEEIKAALRKAFASVDLIKEVSEMVEIPEFDEGEEDDVEYIEGF